MTNRTGDAYQKMTKDKETKPNQTKTPKQTTAVPEGIGTVLLDD